MKTRRLLIGILIIGAIFLIVMSFNAGFVSLSKSSDEDPIITIEEFQQFETSVKANEACVDDVLIEFDEEAVAYYITYAMDETCSLSDSQYYNLVNESIAIMSKVTEPAEDLSANYFGRVFDIYNFHFEFIKNGKVVYSANVNKGEQFIAY